MGKSKKDLDDGGFLTAHVGSGGGGNVVGWFHWRSLSVVVAGSCVATGFQVVTETEFLTRSVSAIIAGALLLTLKCRLPVLMDGRDSFLIFVSVADGMESTAVAAY